MKYLFITLLIIMAFTANAWQIELTPASDKNNSGNTEKEVDFLFSLKKIPATNRDSGMTIGNTLIDVGTTVRKILADKLDLSRASFFEEGVEILDQEKILVNTRGIPKGENEQLQSLLMNGIEYTFNVEFTEEERELDSWVASSPNGAGDGLLLIRDETEMRKMSSADGIVSFQNWSIQEVLRYLERSLSPDFNIGKIIDNTSLHAQYSGQFYFQADDLESVLKSLKDDFGIVIERKKVMQKVWVLKSKKWAKSKYTITRTAAPGKKE